jgi:hypothetical protein
VASSLVSMYHQGRVPANPQDRGCAPGPPAPPQGCSSLLNGSRRHEFLGAQTLSGKVCASGREDPRTAAPPQDPRRAPLDPRLSRTAAGTGSRAVQCPAPSLPNFMTPAQAVAQCRVWLMDARTLLEAGGNIDTYKNLVLALEDYQQVAAQLGSNLSDNTRRKAAKAVLLSKARQLLQHHSMSLLMRFQAIIEHDLATQLPPQTDTNVKLHRDCHAPSAGWTMSDRPRELEQPAAGQLRFSVEDGTPQQRLAKYRERLSKSAARTNGLAATTGCD